jgi:hypothetical protein
VVLAACHKDDSPQTTSGASVSPPAVSAGDSTPSEPPAVSIAPTSDSSSDDAKEEAEEAPEHPKTFTCQQTVFVKFHWKKKKHEPHHLKALWRTPDGQVQAETGCDVPLPAQDAAMGVDPHKPLLTGTLHWAGRWTVEVFQDGHSLGVFPFDLSC